MLKKQVFIANRQAGAGVAHRLLQETRRTLWGWRCAYSFPESVQSLKDTVASVDPADTESVFIVGGDGTVSQVLAELVQLSKKGVAVGVLPSGTANDLASELGIPAGEWKLQELLYHRQLLSMDLIDVNGRLFATVGGIGVGASLVREFNESRFDSVGVRALRSTFQSEIYTLLTLKTVLAGESPLRKVRIRCGSLDASFKTPMVFICNQSKLGGDLTVVPQARNDDGKLNALILTCRSRVDMLKALVALKSGKRPEGAILVSGESLEIEDPYGRAIQAFGDGEILVESPKLEFKVVPKALRVYRLKEGIA